MIDLLLLMSYIALLDVMEVHSYLYFSCYIG